MQNTAVFRSPNGSVHSGTRIGSVFIVSFLGQSNESNSRRSHPLRSCQTSARRRTFPPIPCSLCAPLSLVAPPFVQLPVLPPSPRCRVPARLTPPPNPPTPCLPPPAPF